MTRKKTPASQHVAVLGASHKPQRYAHQAQELLKQHGHTVHPISHRNIEFDGKPVYRSISEIPEEIDTLTLYVNPSHLEGHVDDIIAKKPRRIIFNPGTESHELEARFEEAGIPVEHACTLVLLRTDQFDF